MRRALPAVLLLALAAGTAACSSSSAPTTNAAPSATEPSTAPRPPADGGTYASADALLAAMGAADVPCTSPSPVANPSQQGATSLVDCTAFSAGDTAVGTFDTRDDALASAERLALSGMLSGSTYVLVGGNWMLNTDSFSYGASVQAKLGGTVIPVPSSSS